MKYINLFINWLIKILGGKSNEDYEAVISEKSDLSNKLFYIKKKFDDEKKHKDEKIDDLKNLNFREEQRTKESKELLDKLNENFQLKQDEFQRRISKEKQDEISDIKLEYNNRLKSVGFIGIQGEEEIKNILDDAYKNDRIIKVGTEKGKADIEHVIYNDASEKIGVFYYEVKNRKKWSWDEYGKFLEKIEIKTKGKQNKKNNRVLANIFITKDEATPKLNDGQTSHKYKHIEKINKNLFEDKNNNVYIATFNNFLALVQGLRNTEINYSHLREKNDNVNNEKDQAYAFLKSDEFNKNVQLINVAFNSTREFIIEAQKHLDRAQSQITFGNQKVNLLDGKSKGISVAGKEKLLKKKDKTKISNSQKKTIAKK